MLNIIKTIFFILLIVINMNPGKADTNKTAYDFEFKTIDGKSLNFKKFQDKVIVVINVASQCGFTNQYDDMQKIWEDYKSKGLVIIGVPSNDFNQEPDSNEKVKKFCESKFGITFPMTEKVSVKGQNAHPFYIWAKKTYGKEAVPKWNFHKIIINKEGYVNKTFSSFTNPASKKFIKSLNENLEM